MAQERQCPAGFAGVASRAGPLAAKLPLPNAKAASLLKSDGSASHLFRMKGRINFRGGLTGETAKDSWLLAAFASRTLSMHNRLSEFGAQADGEVSRKSRKGSKLE